MSQFESRKTIEALRSGIPSRSVGQYFTGTRQKMISSITERLEQTAEGKSSGMIITGKYGEGKTHMLNTVFSMAHARNMVVSILPLSKESPFDKLHLIFPKLMDNTYLPMREQPGFMHELADRMQDSRFVSDLLLFCSSELKCNKLYYLIKTYRKESSEEELLKLQADLSGDFMANADLKKRYRFLYKEALKYNETFAKTKHSMDYFAFISYVFEALGYNGWVILIDEAELIGRLGKKARLNAYRNMSGFLSPLPSLHSVFTLFAFTASYTDDVIDRKHDIENLEEIYPQGNSSVRDSINAIIRAPQLQPLTKQEIGTVLDTIIDIHSEAYQWNPGITSGQIQKEADSAGFLLRTKIRTAIEILDQLYQYGSYGTITAGKLDTETFEEDIPDLSAIE